MTQIKSFIGYSPDILDDEINKFLTNNKDTIVVKDIKTSVCVEPSGGFTDSRGYATQTIYYNTIVYETASAV